MKAVILAAGTAQHLCPLPLRIPKPLVPLVNRPLISHMLDQLQACGINEVGVVVDSRDGPLANWAGWRRRPGMRFSFFEQSVPLGTAHAVKIAQGYAGSGSFLVIHGDCYLEGGLAGFIQWASKQGLAASLLVTATTQPELYGVVEASNGRAVRLTEKPQKAPCNLVASGVYLFDQRVFSAIDAVRPSARQELEITGALQLLVERGMAVGVFVYEGTWRDMGRPDDILRCNMHVLDHLEPGAGAETSRSEIIGRVEMGPRARIINSRIIGPAAVGEGTAVINSLIGPYTAIGSHVVVEDCEVERCVVLDNCRLRGVSRLEGSVIGEGTKVTRKAVRPQALRLILGEGNEVELP